MLLIRELMYEYVILRGVTGSDWAGGTNAETSVCGGIVLNT